MTKMLGKSPTPELIRRTRERAGLTQTQAAAVVYVGLRAWQRWEADTDLEHHRDMPAGLWELFVLKTAHSTMDGSKADILIDQLTAPAEA